MDEFVVPISVTFDEIRDAFTEWDRRYREDPELFMSQVNHLLRETPETYGDACAPYFISLIMEKRPEVRSAGL